MIIDAHTHIGRFNSWPLARSQPEELVEMLEKERIDYALTSSARAIEYDCVEGNAEVLRAAGTYPRILPLLCVNPRRPREALAELAGCRERGFVGVKLHPTRHEYALDGGDARPVLEYCQNEEIAVLTHSDESDLRCGPAAIAHVARDYPRLQLVVGHACLFSSREVVRVAEGFPNLVLELSVNYEAGKLEDTVRRLGVERLLFGSDAPLHHPSMMVQRIAVMGLSPAQEAQVLGGNAIRVFDLEGMV